MKCKEHTGTEAVAVTIFGNHYCKQCHAQIKSAQASVDGHVDPKECFIVYENKTNGWRSFTQINKDNTGCAHWVAHQRGLKGSRESCADGYLIRTRDVIGRTSHKVDRSTELVKVGDLWVNPGKTHTGLVVNVEDSKVIAKEGDKEVEKTKQKITIRHCSSGQGRVATDDFDRRFGGKGDFYRF